VLEVKLTPESTVTVGYAMADGTATAGEGYVTENGTFIFAIFAEGDTLRIPMKAG